MYDFDSGLLLSKGIAELESSAGKPPMPLNCMITNKIIQNDIL